MFLYEMHIHTKACSACAGSDAYEMIDAYKAKGYAGLVLTNHSYYGNTAVDRNLPWYDFMDAYRQDYLTAKAYGDLHDFDILFGIEIAYGEGKEALVYGLSPELLMETPSLQEMTIQEISTFVRENGGFIVCAHPFRDRAYIKNPNRKPDAGLFDAIEVYNACNGPGENEKALIFAQEVGLPGICGGDVHHHDQLKPTAMAFYERIQDNKTLVNALKKQQYQMKYDLDLSCNNQ